VLLFPIGIADDRRESGFEFVTMISILVHSSTGSVIVSLVVLVAQFTLLVALAAATPMCFENYIRVGLAVTTGHDYYFRFRLFIVSPTFWFLAWSSTYHRYASCHRLRVLLRSSVQNNSHEISKQQSAPRIA
jgi:hypothetical protein